MFPDNETSSRRPKVRPRGALSLRLTVNDISTLAINVVQNGWGYQECLDLLLHAPAGGEVHGPASGRAEERLPAATRRMLEGICEELVAANRRRVDAALRRGRPARESRGSAEESSHRQDSET